MTTSDETMGSSRACAGVGVAGAFKVGAGPGAFEVNAGSGSSNAGTAPYVFNADGGTRALHTLDALTTPGLRASQQHLAQHLDAVERRLGSEALALFDLPALGPESIVAEQVRVAATLYWTREIDAAGLLAVVEALAQGTLRGTVTLPLGRAIHDLVSFARERTQHFGPAERKALYLRVFPPGDRPGAAGFEAELGHLVNRLLEFDRMPDGQDGAHLMAGIATAARQLGSGLSQRSAGSAAFAARDITDRIAAAWKLLEDEDMARALGGGRPWTLVARRGPLLLGRALAPTRHVSRAEAGRAIIDWIADRASILATGQIDIKRGDAVLRQAAVWRASFG